MESKVTRLVDSTAVLACVFRGMGECSEWWEGLGGGSRCPPPATIRRTPDRLSLAGCTPAESASVSPADFDYPVIRDRLQDLGPIARSRLRRQSERLLSRQRSESSSSRRSPSPTDGSRRYYRPRMAHVDCPRPRMARFVHADCLTSSRRSRLRSRASASLRSRSAKIALSRPSSLSFGVT